MKRYKVREVLVLLSQDGWRMTRCRGSHRQYNHPTKSGTVTLRGKPSDTISQFELNSVWKQAGWR